MSPDDEGRFTNDIIVSVELSGFKFFPAENVLRLGDTSYEFKVGIDKDMMAGTYLLSFTKTESGNTNVYNNISNILAVVTSAPDTITIQKSIEIALGGCS